MAATLLNETPRYLKRYLDRIGAKQSNFRRWTVDAIENGYPKTVARIWIDRDTNEFRCSSKEHAPTKEELEKIVEDLKDVIFPKSIGISLVKAKEVEGKAEEGSALYFIHDRQHKNKVIFVQEVRGRGTDKVFVPHTFFDDGEWRIMEPDGPLPFWKPEKKRRVARIMCHEGAKAAEAAETIASDPSSQHPWAETLRLYDHWGMLGGAHAAYRANYDEIKAESPKEFVYAADNDFPGRRMIQDVSRYYSLPMKCVKYGDGFPPAWDIADEMPETMFGDKGRFIGPDLTKLFQPATRATELVQTGAKGRPAAVLRDDFCREWIHVVKPEVYIHMSRPNMLYAAEQFNNMVRPFSDVDNTAGLMKGNDAIKAGIIKYDPSSPTGMSTTSSGEIYLNTFVPARIKEEAGGAKPFEDYMEHLVPIQEDRDKVLKWLATLIARPQTKMHYGLLLSGPQGVGKSTLGEKILTPLVGEDNTSTPSETDITESTFNYWQPHRRLAIIHEIYSGQSSKAYNKLKSVITDRNIEVNQKFMAVYRIENWCHIFACSNSRKPIQMSTDDRRWLVPGITEETKPPAYWIAFNHWLERDGGLGKIRKWASDYVTKHGYVMSGEEAPWTSTKFDIVDEGMSEGMRFVTNFMNAVEQELNGSPSFFVDTAMIDVIRDVVHGGRTDKLERPYTIRKVAKSCGWHINVSGPIPYKIKWGQFGKQRAFIMCSSVEDAQKSFEELITEGRRPLDVAGLSQKWGLVKNM